MKLITNKISLGKSRSFPDFIKKALAEREGVQLKTASVGSATKVAENADGDSDCCEGKNKGRFPEDFDPKQEAEDEQATMATSDEKEVIAASDEGEKEKGKFPDGFVPSLTAEDKEASSDDKDNEVKESEVSDEDITEKEASSDDEDKEVEASSDDKEEGEVKEAGSLPEALKEHQFKSKKDSKDDDSKDGESSDDDTKEESSDKCSKVISDFVRIANLTPKQREFVHKYFTAIYPKEYVDAMVQDR